MRYWILAGLLVASFLVLDIGQRIHMISLGYEREQLVEMRRNLERVHRELLIERETLSALDRIERIAIRSLGMKRPGSRQIVHVGVLPENKSFPVRESEITVVRK